MPTKPKRPVLPTVEVIPSLVSACNEEEYSKGIVGLKYNKAACIDDVLVEQLIKPRIQSLQTMLSKCLAENKIPRIWIQLKIMAILKPLLENHLIKEQAGFRPGKSCTSQLLNLTQHIKDGYQ